MPFTAVPWPGGATSGCPPHQAPAPVNSEHAPLSWTFQGIDVSLLKQAGHSPGATLPARSHSTPPHGSSASQPPQQAPSLNTSTSKHKKSSKPTASSPPTSKSPGVPCLLFGSVFSPCNTINLFYQDQPELDQLFSVPWQLSTSSVQSATHPRALPETFQEGVNNLKRSNRHAASPGNHLKADHTQDQSQTDKQPNKAQASQPAAVAGSSQPALTPTAYMFSPTVQLMLRMVSPVQGLRCFFSSAQAANTARCTDVIDRHSLFLGQRSAEAAIAPGAVSSTHEQRMSGWQGQLSDWMQSTFTTTRPPWHAVAAHTAPSAAAAGGGAAGGSAADSTVDTKQSSNHSKDSGQANQNTGGSNFKGADDSSGLKRTWHRSSAGQPDERGCVVKSHLQIPAILARLIRSAIQITAGGGDLDLRALQYHNLSAEAQHINKGGQGWPGEVEAPTSFVGRMPLEDTFKLMCAAPELFQYMPHAVDRQIAAELVGKAVVMDLDARSDRWQFKVPSEDEDESATKDDASLPVSAMRVTATTRDASDGMGVVPRATPVLHVPGITVSMKTAEGQLLYLTPAFLSVKQLHGVLEAGRALAHNAWYASRKAHREAARKRLEGLAIALSGLGGAAAPTTASRSSAAQEDEDDDEDGMGELPEAKALLAELGEGSKPAANAAVPGMAAPAGIASVLSTVAVGAVSLAGYGLAAIGDTWDMIQSKTAWGKRAIGFPNELAVSPGFLEETLEQLQTENESRSRTWQAKRARKQLRKSASAGGGVGDGSSDVSGSKQLGFSLPVDLSTVLDKTSSAAGRAQQVSGSASETKSEEGVSNGNSNDDDRSAESPVVTSSDDRNPGLSSSTGHVGSTGHVSSTRSGHDGSAGTSGVGGSGDSSRRSGKVVLSQKVTGPQAGGGVVGASTSGQAQPQPALESLPGVAFIFNTAWTALFDAQRDGQLGAALANGWAGGQVRVSTNSDDEVAVTMLVRMRAGQLPTSSTDILQPPTSTPPTPSSSKASGQGAVTGGTSSGTGQPGGEGTPARAGSGSGGPGDAQQRPGDAQQRPGEREDDGSWLARTAAAAAPLSSPLPGLPMPRLTEGEEHKFEIGLHLNLKKLTGKVPRDAHDLTTLEKTALRGLLLIGDLGLVQDPVLGTPTAEDLSTMTPPVGCFDMAQHLAVYKQRLEGNQGSAVSWLPAAAAAAGMATAASGGSNKDRQQKK